MLLQPLMGHDPQGLLTRRWMLRPTLNARNPQRAFTNFHVQDLPGNAFAALSRSTQANVQIQSENGRGDYDTTAAEANRVHARGAARRNYGIGTAAKPERSDAAAERMARARFSERSAAAVRGNARQHGPSKPRRIR